MPVSDLARLQESDFPEGYTVLLSSNLSRYTIFNLEVSFVSIEPHGAVLFSRFISGEYAQQFELSEAEVEEFIKTWRRRKSLLKLAEARASAELDAIPLPF